MRHPGAGAANSSGPINDLHEDNTQPAEIERHSDETTIVKATRKAGQNRPRVDMTYYDDLGNGVIWGTGASRSGAFGPLV